MRTTLLIFVGFAILAVTLAIKKPTKKSPQDVKKSAKEIPEDLEDVLNDVDVEKNNIEIPNLNQLTTDSDPIALGQEIKNLTDKKKQRELLAKLKKSMNENKESLPAKFYRAAYASFLNKEKASRFWNKELQTATNVVKNAATGGKDIVGKVGTRINNAVGDARQIAQIGPVTNAIRRGESVLLSVLSNATKTLGKITDFGHDVAGNTSRFVRAATFFVDPIPIAGDIKKNIHDLIEEGVDRGKFITGSFADNTSDALARASSDAGKKADERDELLRRQFSSRRSLV